VIEAALPRRVAKPFSETENGIVDVGGEDVVVVLAVVVGGVVVVVLGAVDVVNAPEVAAAADDVAGVEEAVVALVVVTAGEELVVVLLFPPHPVKSAATINRVREIAKIFFNFHPYSRYWISHWKMGLPDYEHCNTFGDEATKPEAPNRQKLEQLT
jgi:hypothetical protein